LEGEVKVEVTEPVPGVILELEEGEGFLEVGVTEAVGLLLEVEGDLK